MATVSITIPNNEVERIENAFAAAYGYQETIQDVNNPEVLTPNPTTKTQFTRQQIIRYIKNVVRDQEKRQAEAQINIQDINAS